MDKRIRIAQVQDTLAGAIERAIAAGLTKPDDLATAVRSHLNSDSSRFQIYKKRS